MSRLAVSFRKEWKFGLVGRLFTSGVRRGHLATAGAVDDATIAEPTRWEDAKPLKNMPGPNSLPIPYLNFIWNLIKMSNTTNFDIQQWHMELRKKYGDIILVKNMGPKDMIFLYDPVDIEKMHRNESAWPIRQGIDCLDYYQTHVRKDIYGITKGLSNLQGKEWHEARSAVNPTMMQPRRAKMYTEPIEAIADEFIQRIKKIRDDKLEMPSDFANELNKWSLETIAFVAIDSRLGCLPDDLDEDSEAQKMISMTITAFECIFYMQVIPSLWSYVSTPTWKKFVKSLDYMTDFTYERVMRKVNATQNQEGEPKSVLESLLRSKSPKFAVVMAMDMLIAGIETTSNGVATTLTYLAENPKQQEKLFAEMKKFLPEKTSPLTASILDDMKYLKATIKEGQRLKPVVFGNTRTTVKDLVVKGYQIPKGTSLFSMNAILSVDERYFKRPNEFIPERWLKSETYSEMSVSHVSPFISLPFGFGPRMCIGRRFAELEMEIMVAKIIRHFRISYPYGKMEWHNKLFTKPSKPLKFKMEDRDE